MLRPPWLAFVKTPISISAVMSRSAVSGEQWQIFAHLLLVSGPSKPSNRRLITFLCLSLKSLSEYLSQNAVLFSTPCSRFSEDDIASPIR